jgi:hypothetical protein
VTEEPDRRDASPKFRVLVALMTGAVAVLAATFTYLGAQYGNQADEAASRTERATWRAFARTAAASHVTIATEVATRTNLLAEIEALARVLAVSPHDNLAWKEARSIQQASSATTRNLRGFISALEPDPKETAADPQLIEYLRSPQLAKVAAALSGRSTQTEPYGAKRERTSLAVGFLAIAAALLGPASLLGSRPAGRVLLAFAALILIAGGVWGATAPLIS